VSGAAVFLDKDGTLIENVPYNVDPARIKLSPGAVKAVGRLAEGGFRLFVVSNQPGAALGYFEERALDAVARRLRELLPALDGFYYCPHAPAARCGCRKPEQGLLLRAADEHGIVLRQSWMVGDILDDIEAGRRSGCRTILIDNGNETQWKLSAQRRPDHVAGDLVQASRLILEAQ
jgi:D-glycero-D-manno-heptose 1,7-bisphosphate phosphatase